jgi:hypothetical protein
MMEGGGMRGGIRVVGGPSLLDAPISSFPSGRVLGVCTHRGRAGGVGLIGRKRTWNGGAWGVGFEDGERRSFRWIRIYARDDHQCVSIVP